MALLIAVAIGVGGVALFSWLRRYQPPPMQWAWNATVLQGLHGNRLFYRGHDALTRELLHEPIPEDGVH